MELMKKVIIYWIQEWQRVYYCNLFNLSLHVTLNHRTAGYVTPADYDHLLELQQRNILRLVTHA